MGKEPTKRNKKRIIKRKHYHVLIWSAIVAILIVSTSTFAWYTVKKREADSAPAEVMKPYYLTLLNPSETDLLQLSVGNLFPGETKQVVFCVSNRDNESNSAMEMGVSEFDYSIEMIYTENLALIYNIYELEKAEGVTEGNVPDGIIIALDTLAGTGEDSTSEITYWNKIVSASSIDGKPAALKGTDVSSTRHSQVGITGTEINAGKYISYAKTDKGGESGTESIDNNLHLSPVENGYDAQYFVLEIEWQDGAASNFEKYEKETDMIYLLVEAIQPKPEKVESGN